MVKTPTSNVGDVQGTKMLHATQQKNKLKKKKKGFHLEVMHNNSVHIFLAKAIHGAMPHFKSHAC